MSDSSSFFLLDERIQRFIWQQGWTELRDAQEQAIPPIVSGERDVIIAAATAAGKTEAAFLPALTHLLQPGNEERVIVYMSPLKALINDQFGRLDLLCADLDIKVWPWHGDISSSLKTRFFKSPKGVVLITPESVESMLCTRGSSIPILFEKLAYFVVDELHAFIGTERGKQLQTLMHRIESAIGRCVPRIGLSATLGDMAHAAAFLRPGRGEQVVIIDSRENRPELQILVKGYEEPVVAMLGKRKKARIDRAAGDAQPVPAGSGEALQQDADLNALRLQEEDNEDGSVPDSLAGHGGQAAPRDGSAEGDAQEEQEDEAGEPVCPEMIAAHLFKTLRGSNNLIFPNSRREVERFAHLLSEMCERSRIPNEFWPHHGNLSREIRSEAEAALKRRDQTANAVCTSTLELGIDIGAVKSVAQIMAPPSVASLRQRLGRSGRRAGEPAILRGYCIEDALTSHSGIVDELRAGTIEMAAMITLLVEGWFEPPPSRGMHLSTLVMQLLALIAERGGVTAAEAHRLLLGPNAPFSGLTQKEYVALLKHLGDTEILVQEASGALLHGPVAEKLVNHYSFYAAFATQDEYRLVSGPRTIGSLAVTHMLLPGQHIVFGGKTWRVEEINDREKTIIVARTRGGRPPSFAGEGGRIHQRVRERMRAILRTDLPVPFLDRQARQFLTEARGAYRRMELDDRILIDAGSQCVIATWCGHAVNEVLLCLLTRHGMEGALNQIGIVVGKSGKTLEQIGQILGKAAAEPFPDLAELMKNASNLQQEKWDWVLPKWLLQKSYASLYLDFDGARQWLLDNFNGSADQYESNAAPPER